MQEDNRGSYIFNSKDLNMLPYLQELKDIGVNSIKIEGRMKSPFYVATVVNAYRRALDILPKKPNEELCQELLKTSHRRYTTGFYFGDKDLQNLESSTPVQEREFMAVVTEDAKDGMVEVEMRNKFSVGDTLEVLSPDKNFNKNILIKKIINSAGVGVGSAKVVQEKVKINCDLSLKKGDILRK